MEMCYNKIKYTEIQMRNVGKLLKEKYAGTDIHDKHRQRNGPETDSDWN